MLTHKEHDIIDRHMKCAGLRDGACVAQWDQHSSKYSHESGRLWVFRHNKHQSSRQDLYFHSIDSVAATLTCYHGIKLWDLRRKLTAREMARLQGFPDTFRLPSTNVQILLGNAVAIPCAARAIATVCHPHDSVRLLDVCSGIGGFSLATKLSCPSMRCVGASEICPRAIRCYEENFPDVPQLGDARMVKRWPACDLLTAGVPCQPFSSSNTQGKEDARFAFIEVILGAVRTSGASRVVIENVPLYQNHAPFQLLCDTLRQLRFHVQYQVLDAQYFGLAQSRRRLYIVACNDGYPRPFEGRSYPSRCIRDILLD